MPDPRLPTHKDINVYGSLDELAACEHFLGKGLEEAEQLFRDNSLYYQEDLMWMGPVAFRFYVEAAIRYVQSPASEGDSDIVSCLAAVLEFRLEHEPRELVPVAPQLRRVCEYTDKHWDRFNVDPGIYAGLRERYAALQQTFVRMERQTQAE